MNRIQMYIQKLVSLYGNDIIYEKSSYDEAALAMIPETL